MQTIRGMLLPALLIGVLGCHPSTQQSSRKQSRPAISSSKEPRPDPLAKAGGCDSRLQDIGGLFLMYSLMNHRLPESLDELRAIPGASDVGDFTCPVSKQPYIYDRDGKPLPSGAGRTILYDSAP